MQPNQSESDQRNQKTTKVIRRQSDSNQEAIKATIKHIKESKKQAKQLRTNQNNQKTTKAIGKRPEQSGSN